MKTAGLVALVWLLPLSLFAETEIEAYGMLAAATRDAGGDTIGGIGSGIDYDTGNRFFCVTDRGAGDGMITYRPRIVSLNISRIEDSDRLRVDMESSVILRDEKKEPFTGLRPLGALRDHPQMKPGVSCIDPEGIALAPDGTVYISDEYAPCLYQFRRDGSMIRRIRVPEHYTPRDTSGAVNYTEDATIKTGRTPNRGFEGLSILPDGKTGVMILQSALAQDGGRTGRLTRIVMIDLASEKVVAEYAYPFENYETVTGKKPGDKGDPNAAGLSVNDITAIDEHRFLVLERDALGENGADDAPPARYKAVWLVDIRAASNLLDPKYAAHRSLAKGGAEIRPLSEAKDLEPVGKKFLFNLPELKFGFGENGPTALSLGAKWEGLAFLRISPEGAIDLMMTSDNDFLTPHIYEEGKATPFPRARKSQDALFLKIRTQIPKG